VYVRGHKLITFQVRFWRREIQKGNSPKIKNHMEKMPKYFEMPLKYVIKGILTEKSAFRHQHPHLSCMENLSNFFMKYCLTRVGNPCCCFPMLWLLQALSQ
jgi:hypothetical protein